MAKSMVKRKKFIRSYAGVTTGAAKYTIEPLTRQAAQYARDRCPVDTGDLKDSITWDVRGTTGMIKAHGGSVTLSNGRPSSVAILVEFGTPKMRARSFLRYGVNKAKREVKAAFKQGFAEAMNEQRT